MSVGEVTRIIDQKLGESNFIEIVGTDGRDLIITVRFDSDDHARVAVLGAPGLHLTTFTRESR